MKVKVRMNQANIRKVKKQAQLALIDTGESVKTDLIQSQTMPFDKGTMQNDSTFVDDRRVVVSLVSDTPYARKVYFDPEITIHQEKNPNAKQRWFDDYISGDKKDLAMRHFAKHLKRRLGG